MKSKLSGSAAMLMVAVLVGSARAESECHGISASGEGEIFAPVCCCCCCNTCDCGPSLYASFNLAGSFLQMRQGGFNTVGFFSNEGFSDNEDTCDVGGTVGIALPRNFGTLRGEAQVMYHDTLNSVTGSFPGLPGPPTFFYRSTVENRWSAMGNLWYDIPVGCRPLNVYLGGGLGVGGADVALTDLVVEGKDNYTDLVWQVGGGITYDYNRRLTIDLGYRYIDFGRADIAMTWVAGTLDAGNFTADLSAHQIMLGFRFNALEDFLPCR